MPRTPKPAGQKELKTGDDFIKHAEKRGALIVPDRRKGFTEIRTPAGSMFVTPGTQPLDYRTRKNWRHWFRLLGLLGIVLAIALIDFIWGLLGLPYIF